MAVATQIHTKQEDDMTAKRKAARLRMIRMVVKLKGYEYRKLYEVAR